MKKIGIVMGSDSDLPVVEKAMATLEKFGVPFEAHVYSAHRTPVEASEFAKGARANGFGAIIAAAGKAAHLAGCHGGKYNPSCNRYSYQILYIGWIGCPAFHRTDAGGTSCCDRSH